MKNVQRSISTSKSDKVSPRASRPIAKRSRSSVGSAGAHTAKVGDQSLDATRHHARPIVAGPVSSRAKAPAKKLKASSARATDFEAPVTITVSGRTAAVIRFAAYQNGRTPEEEAEECIKSDALNDLESGFGHTPNSAKAWLNGEEV